MNHTIFYSIGLVHLDVQAFHSGGPGYFFQTCHQGIYKGHAMSCQQNSIQEHSRQCWCECKSELKSEASYESYAQLNPNQSILSYLSSVHIGSSRTVSIELKPNLLRFFSLQNIIKEYGLW